MFVLPIIAGTFIVMSVFLTLPLLSLLSFQSIPTIDWCSFPFIATYFGDLVDLGMDISPRVTCCAVTSAGVFAVALLIFLGYYAMKLGRGSYSESVVGSGATVVLPVPSVSTISVPPPVVTSNPEDQSVADVTVVDEISPNLLQTTSLPTIVTLKAEVSDNNIPLHSLSPAASVIDIPVDTDDNNLVAANTHTLFPSASAPDSMDETMFYSNLSSHGSITTNLVDISDDLLYDNDTDAYNPWLASPEPSMDAEFAVQIQQLIASIAALEISSSVDRKLPRHSVAYKTASTASFPPTTNTVIKSSESVVATSSTTQANSNPLNPQEPLPALSLPKRKKKTRRGGVVARAFRDAREALERQADAAAASINSKPDLTTTEISVSDTERTEIISAPPISVAPDMDNLVSHAATILYPAPGLKVEKTQGLTFAFLQGKDDNVDNVETLADDAQFPVPVLDPLPVLFSSPCLNAANSSQVSGSDNVKTEMTVPDCPSAPPLAPEPLSEKTEVLVSVPTSLAPSFVSSVIISPASPSTVPAEPPTTPAHRHKEIRQTHWTMGRLGIVLEENHRRQKALEREVQERVTKRALKSLPLSTSPPSPRIEEGVPEVGPHSSSLPTATSIPLSSPHAEGENPGVALKLSYSSSGPTTGPPRVEENNPQVGRKRSSKHPCSGNVALSIRSSRSSSKAKANVPAPSAQPAGAGPPSRRSRRPRRRSKLPAENSH